jgi:hypothetical protein
MATELPTRQRLTKTLETQNLRNQQRKTPPEKMKPKNFENK